MITPTLLPEKSLYSLSYGAEETVKPKKPIGVDKLPDEWAQKLKPYHFDQPLLHVVENVSLAGPNLAGIKDDDLILSVGYYGRIDLWERNKPYWEWAMLCMTNPPEEIDCAFSMAGVWSGNYFHWLIDHLPTLEAYDKYVDETGEEPTILIAGGKPPPFVIESLEEWGAPYIVDTHGHYKVKRLIVPTWPREEGYIRPSAMNYLRLMWSGIPDRSGRRMYISRRNAKTRRVMNEEALENYLLVEGFGTEVMENLTFKEQRDRIAEADFVIGPHGAGLANIVLGNSDNVIEFVHPNYTNPCCWLIGDTVGAKYGYMVGDPSGYEDMDVDLKKLQYVMEKMP